MAEWDIGSYDRAKKKAGTVDLHQYPSPLNVLEDFGVLDFTSTGASGKGGVRIAHNYDGWIETYWTGFVKDYLEALKSPIQRLIVDTAKLEWEAAQNCTRERFQKDPRFKNVETDRLKRLEYEEPNKEQMALIHAAKSANKDLVWVGHAKELWSGGEPTGRYGLDGWSKLDTQADIVLETSIRSRKPAVTIRKGHLDLLGMELESPTLDLIIELFDAAKVITDNEVPLPQVESDEPNAQAKAIIQLAGML